MFKNLKKLWNQLWCNHHWEVAYTEDTRSSNKIYHYICLHCEIERVTTEKLEI